MKRGKEKVERNVEMTSVSTALSNLEPVQHGFVVA